MAISVTALVFKTAKLRHPVNNSEFFCVVMPFQLHRHKKNTKTTNNIHITRRLFMSKKVGYARVSTIEQADNTHALEQQIDRLKKAEADEIFVDVESGANTKRPEFNKMMDLVKLKQIQEVIATRWDRLTRDESHYTQIKKTFQVSGVQLRLLDAGGIVDLETAVGELSADMQAMIAVHERRMIRDRVIRGYEHRRQRLAAGVRPPYGYRIDHNDKYELHTAPIICLLTDRPSDSDNSNNLFPGRSRADIAREAIEKFLELRITGSVLAFLHDKYIQSAEQKTVVNPDKSGKKVQISIADELLLWSSTEGFRNWIANPVLQGHTAYKKQEKRQEKEQSGKLKRSRKPPSEWEIHENTHPQQRLISDEEAFELKLILQSNSKIVPRARADFYLTKRIFCFECRATCQLKGGGHSYYGCRHSRVHCSNGKNVRIEKIDQAIIYALVDRAVQLEKENCQLDEHQPRAKELSDLQSKLAAIEAIPGHEYDVSLKSAISNLNKRIDYLRSQYQLTSPIAEKILRFPEAAEINFWYSLTQLERKTFYDLLVSRVFIKDGKVVSVELTV